MKWRKLGRVYCANNENEFMVTGGRAPVPLFVGGDCFKIFFSSYDSLGRGRIFSLLLDLKPDFKVLEILDSPVIDIGDTGRYDDNGIIPSCILNCGDKQYLYLSGFSVKNKVIFDSAAGLAVSEDAGASFCKFSGPVLDRSVDDPCFATSPFVLFDKGLFKMWHVSCMRWGKDSENRLKHFYNIRYKESKDPVYWPIKSSIAIDFANDFEYAIARPSVIVEAPDNYKMWYCFREQQNIDTYRIGYAASTDGREWERRDHEAGIDVSATGWDSEMICYPYVFEHKGQKYMLYNGNGYGRTGFGLAVLEEDS